MANIFEKDPQAKLPYAWDFVGDSYLSEGETIDSYVLTPDPGVTVHSSQQVNGVITALISGGTPGKRHAVRCHIVTTPNAYEDDRTIYLRIVDR
jgi:hypothetical protein